VSEDCVDVRFRLAFLRRGELDAAEAEAVRRHLEVCADCTHELERERELTARLRGEGPAWTAPADLRERLAAELERAAAPSRGERARRWARRPAIAAALGAAAMLAIAVPAYWLTRPVEPPESVAAVLGEAAASYQRAALQGDLLGRDAADAARMVAEIQRRFDLPATYTFRGDGELRLLAARPTYVMGRAGAEFVFADAAGNLVTLQFLRCPEMQIPRDKTTPVAAYRPLLTQRDGTRIAVWKQGSTVYALAGGMDQAELSRVFLKVREATKPPA
jgi:anti-sigma factor RsiW